MISKEDLKKLASLSRLSLSPEELGGLTKDIEGILAYVAELQHASGTTATNDSNRKNVVREDGEPHESGFYAEKLLQAAPDTEDGFIKVKKILG